MYKLRKETIVKYGVLLLVVLAIMFLTKKYFVGAVQDGFNDANGEFEEVFLDEAVIEQSLALRQPMFSISLLVKNSGDGSETAQMELWNQDGTHQLKAEEVNIPISGGEETILVWNTSDVDFTGIEEVVLKISGGKNPEQVAVCVQKEEGGLPYKQNGSEMDFHVRMTVVYAFVRYWGLFIFSGIILLLLGAVCIYAWDHRLKVEKTFAAIALIAGIGMAIVNPLGQEPDGWNHFIRAMDVSYGNVLAPFINNAHEGGYNRVPVNMMGEIQFKVIEAFSDEGGEYVKHLTEIKFSKESVLAKGECGYTSLFYFPQALGTLIGRLLNLNVFFCMALGRIFNLLCYITLTYWAIKKLPVYRNLMAAVALLPLTVYQAASYSYDAMLNGLCFLFVGLCFHCAYGEMEKPLNWKKVIWLGVILALLFLCKYVYVCLGLLVFLIPKKKFGTKKDYWKSFGIALLPIVFILALYGINFSVTSSKAAVSMGETAEAAEEASGQPGEASGALEGASGQPDEAGGAAEEASGQTSMADGTAGEEAGRQDSELEPDGTGAEETGMTQLDYVKSNPFEVIKVLGKSVKTYFNMYVFQLNILGWLRYPLDILQTIVPCFLVAVACLDTINIRQKIRAWHKLVFAAAGGITIALSMLGLYLLDTVANPVGVATVSGYQSRYAIPCLVILLGIFTSGKVENRIEHFSVKVIGCMSAFLAYALLMLVNACY